MKPADRALEIVVVGLGQGGGNLAAAFSRLGYDALALNTAHTDLSSLEGSGRGPGLPADKRLYVGIDGYDGAGSDLNYGRECVNENAERIRAAVKRHAAQADVVVLAAGLGGGTGSALSQLVDVLQPLELPLLALATIPGEHESGIAKVNAVRGVSELVKAEVLGWLFADNARLAQDHGGVSVDRYFETINRRIVEPLDAFNRLNDRDGLRAIRTFDGEDFRTVLLSGGVLNLASRELSQITVGVIGDRVQELCYDSGVSPAGFSLEDASYLGIVIEAPERLLSGTPFATFERLSETLKSETRGGAVYLGVYETDSSSGTDDETGLIRLIAATPTLPEGVKSMVDAAKREGGALREKLERTVSPLDLGEIADFDLVKTSLRGASPKGSRRRLPEKPDLEIEDNLSRLGPTPSPPAASRRDGGADDEGFDQLVAQFNEEGTPRQARRRIMGRLAKAKKSDVAPLRRRAEEAIKQLNADFVREVLRESSPPSVAPPPASSAPPPASSVPPPASSVRGQDGSQERPNQAARRG